MYIWRDIRAGKAILSWLKLNPTQLWSVTTSFLFYSILCMQYICSKVNDLLVCLTEQDKWQITVGSGGNCQRPESDTGPKFEMTQKIVITFVRFPRHLVLVLSESLARRSVVCSEESPSCAADSDVGGSKQSQVKGQRSSCKMNSRLGQKWRVFFFFSFLSDAVDHFPVWSSVISWRPSVSIRLGYSSLFLLLFSHIKRNYIIAKKTSKTSNEIVFLLLFFSYLLEV